MTPEQEAAVSEYLELLQRLQGQSDRGVVAAYQVAVALGDAHSPAVGQAEIDANRAGIERHHRKLEWLAEQGWLQRCPLPQHLQPGPMCYRNFLVSSTHARPSSC